LTIEQVRTIRTWLQSDKKAMDRDLPDLVAFMVATGLRIGEALAVRWDDLDLEAGTVEVRGTVLRVKGKGLVLKPSPKSEAGQRILTLPGWCIALLQQRAANGLEPIAENAPIFPAPLSGTLRDPSNTRRGLREAFAEMGLPGVTSHAFRKTVATLMDDAGLTARAAADQLGHSKTSMTQDRYMGRKVRATGAAAVLEVLGDV
jgi:integrase